MLKTRSVSLARKQCVSCKMNKQESQFAAIYDESDNYVGRAEICKVCDKPGQDDIKNRRYQRTYGISLSDYQDMLSRQNGCCAICGVSSIGSRALVVDHCHATGRVRGLLCYHCNALLGMAHDDVSVLENTIKYLNAQ